MSTYAVQGETLGLIADAIRGKLGTDEPMEVSSMASLIESIPSGGLHGIYETQITVDTQSAELVVTHNIGIKPHYAVAENTKTGDEINNRGYGIANCTIDLISSGVVAGKNIINKQYNRWVIDKTPILTEQLVIFASNTTNVYYAEGDTYNVKIYY